MASPACLFIFLNFSHQVFFYQIFPPEHSKMQATCSFWINSQWPVKLSKSCLPFFFFFFFPSPDYIKQLRFPYQIFLVIFILIQNKSVPFLIISEIIRTLFCLKPTTCPSDFIFWVSKCFLFVQIIFK